MIYENIKPAVFISRPNRFIAVIELEEEPGVHVVCHVKNTGRCKELLIPGVRIYVQKASNPNRKTLYDLIGVQKGERLINMDSQIPNAVAKEWIEAGGLFHEPVTVRSEVRYGDSRIDLYAESAQRKAFIEVKGVTLEDEGIARFPDAPTQRGVKHIHELIHCLEAGYESYLLFVIQMDNITQMEPNDETHKAFGDALRLAQSKGVHLLARQCKVTPDGIVMDQAVPIVL